MPIQRYTDFFKKNGLEPDAGQLHVLDQLAKLDQRLSVRSKQHRLIKKAKGQKIQGIYLWGNVGRGKTYLMNLFFNLLSTQRKTRLHFQSFMKAIHNRLYELAGQKEPLAKIASELARKVEIICLDEFYIDDIADAMLMGRLLESLYEKGIVLVVTSNLHPDDLYLKGLNRERFFPAIALLKLNNQVICLDGDKDYRCVSKPVQSVFFMGTRERTQLQLEQYFLNATSGCHESAGFIEANHRKIAFKAKSQGIIWFDFHELCEKPRSQYDYIYIAQHFHTVLISDIPQLDNGLSGSGHDRARRFISLIDELYDKSVNLAASFETELHQIYLGKKFDFQFRRTCSRLIEMQSQDYGVRSHDALKTEDFD